MQFGILLNSAEKAQTLIQVPPGVSCQNMKCSMISECINFALDIPFNKIPKSANLTNIAHSQKMALI